MTDSGHNKVMYYTPTKHQFLTTKNSTPNKPNVQKSLTHKNHSIIDPGRRTNRSVRELAEENNTEFLLIINENMN